MTTTDLRLIRYQTLPDLADANQRLIEEVFAELDRRRIDTLRYAAMRGPDGAFFHLVSARVVSPFAEVPSFEAFQRGLRERCIVPAQPTTLTLIGNHGMLGS